MIATESNDEILLVYGAVPKGSDEEYVDDSGIDDDGNRGQLLFKIDLRFQTNPWARLKPIQDKGGHIISIDNPNPNLRQSTAVNPVNVDPMEIQ